VLLTAVAVGAGLLYATPRLRDVAVADQAVPLVVGRTLEMRDALADTPGWERAIYEWLAGDTTQELKQAISWYEELAAVSTEPSVEAQLLILLGEAGQPERLRERLAVDRSPLQELIRLAYLGPTEDAAAHPFDHEQVASLLSGWFADRLARRWALRTSDAGLLAAAQESARARARPLLEPLRLLTAIQALFLVAGVAALVVARRRQHRGRDAIVVGAAPLPPRWGGWT
jgi:hypothetical protein